MNNYYTLQIKNVTATTADVNIYSNTSPSTSPIQNAQIAFFKESDPTSQFTNNFEDTGTPIGQKVATISLTGLSPKTKYAVHVKRPPIGTYYIFTTKVSPDTLRVATQGQWEDLASKIKNLDSRISALEN